MKAQIVIQKIRGRNTRITKQISACKPEELAELILSMEMEVQRLKDIFKIAQVDRRKDE